MGEHENVSLTGWRSVEVAPEDGEHYLVAQVDRGHKGKLWYTYYLTIYGKWRGDFGEIINGWYHEHTFEVLDNVTHWMPLPRQPAKDEHQQ